MFGKNQIMGPDVKAKKKAIDELGTWRFRGRALLHYLHDRLPMGLIYRVYDSEGAHIGNCGGQDGSGIGEETSAMQLYGIKRLIDRNEWEHIDTLVADLAHGLIQGGLGEYASRASRMTVATKQKCVWKFDAHDMFKNPIICGYIDLYNVDKKDKRVVLYPCMNLHPNFKPLVTVEQFKKIQAILGNKKYVGATWRPKMSVSEYAEFIQAQIRLKTIHLTTSVVGSSELLSTGE